MIILSFDAYLHELMLLERINVGSQTRLMFVMLLIGFLFGVVVLSVIIMVRHLAWGG